MECSNWLQKFIINAVKEAWVNWFVALWLLSCLGKCILLLIVPQGNVLDPLNSGFCICTCNNSIRVVLMQLLVVFVWQPEAAVLKALIFGDSSIIIICDDIIIWLL